MKILLTYKSKSGFTKKYAQMISEQLQIEALEQKRIKTKDLLSYDMIIHGGGLYIGGINGVKKILKNLDLLKGKTVIIFAVGATPPRESDIQHVIDHNFTESHLSQIKFFYCRGGFDYSKLNLIDKVLMNLLRMKLKRKKNRTPDETGMLHAYDQALDLTNPKNIIPLIEYVNQCLESISE